MGSVVSFLQQQLSQGQISFSSDAAMTALGCSESAWFQSATRLAKNHRLASPKRGFYLILRPEDLAVGAPDPVRWIDVFMRHLGVDYRISLLRAAAFHGSSHQSAMVFQVIAPRQIRSFDVGRYRVQFIYQAPDAFTQVNQAEWLTQLKSETGFAKVAGVELTLLDSVRYFHKSAGISGAAQIVNDLGAKASPRKLVKAAAAYDNSAVRRLGYLLERFGYERQADALLPFAKMAKSMKLLDPSVKLPAALAAIQADVNEKNSKWKLVVNETVEIDA
jgi:hypothetical protein